MKAILVIRNDDKFSWTLGSAGFDVVNLELIETRPLEDLSELRDRLSKLSQYDGLFFTSPVAAEIFVKERNGSNGFHGDVYALGQRAQNALKATGLNLKVPPRANTAEEMLKEFGEDQFTGKHFLFIRGEKSLRTIPELLNGVATIDEVAVYKTDKPEMNPTKIADIRSRLSSGEFGLVCFFSPSGIKIFAELFGATQDVGAAVIGMTTANAAKQGGFKVGFISPRSNANDFARGLIEYIKSIE